MAEETPSEQTVDQELEALLAPTKSAAPAAGEPPPKTVASPPEAAAETPAGDEDPLLKALNEIKDGEETPAEEGKGALTQDQQQILQAIPDIQTATNLYGVVENYKNFTDSLEAGRFDDVEAMLSTWNKDVIDGWLEHIYEKKVASGEWVDRFIAETGGSKPEAGEIRKLKNDVKALRDSLTEKETRNTKAQQQQVQQQTANKALTDYNTHVEGLFEQIGFSKADRRWVLNDINKQLVQNPEVLAAVKAGKPAAINKIFKAACKEYIERDKVVATEKGEKIDTQSKKKAPLGGAGGAETEALPDDIKQVPKGKTEAWLDQQLGKIFKNKK